MEETGGCLGKKDKITLPGPVSGGERYVILDFLRGFALFGICLANFSEFSLYSFLSTETVQAMPTAAINRIVRYLQYIFIDGKFYTIFSLLFGVGFSILISGYLRKNLSSSIFYRRMIILLFIGLFHLYFLWAGDILILYAALGLLLPLFSRISDKSLLLCAVSMLLFPILVDTLIVVFGWNLSAPVIKATEYFHHQAGITASNFPVWLAEKQSYWDVLRFNLGGSFIRLQEFIEGNRAFKVLGLFLLGLYIGRHKFFTRLDEILPQLKKICFYSFLIGIPTSLLYAWNAMNAHPLGMVGSAAVYAISVAPMSFGYIAAICLWYRNHQTNKIAKLFAASGRMALSNYLMQSVFGMLIFYGIGLGIGATVGLAYVELIALLVYTIQVVYSNLWLTYFRFGLLEWVWRMLTYRKRLKIKI